MHDQKLKKGVGVSRLVLVLLSLMAFGLMASTGLVAAMAEKMPGSYKVVGIGPGDGDLLTVRAAEAIQHADMVFCSQKTQQKLAPYIDFSGKKVVDGYGVLFRYYGRDCTQVSQKKPEKKTRKGARTCEDYHRRQAEFAAMVRENVKAGRHVVLLSSGDADLITLRGLNVIKSADVVFAHKLLKEKFKEALSGKLVHTEYHRLFPFYGQPCTKVQPKAQKRERMSCEQYHKKQEEFAALVRKAVAQGKTVVMLDSGDPLVYGPCAWSLTELRDLDTEVVPGLSCFNAANAALKAGVTEGGNSHSVLLASGWSVKEMAVHQSTMVLFTMRTEFKKFIDGLSAHYAADTPVAIVFSAGYAEKEKVLRGTLGTILNQTGSGKLPFEYLLYIGDFLSDGGRVAH